MADRSLVVRLEAVIDDYKRGMEDAAQATEKVGQASEKAQGQVRTSTEQGRRSLTGFLEDNERALKGMEGLGRTLTTTVTAPIAGLGTAVALTGTNYNALEQRSRAALTTLLGSAEAATSQMEELYEFTSGSPFPRQTWIEAQQQLVGFGTAAEDVVPILGAVEDAVAATGGSAQDIGEIVDVLARIQGQGRITGIELQRLGIRGIDAASILADQFGVTGDEIRSQISAGAIGAEEALDALVAGMNERFGGAAENVKQTWDGAIDRVKAAFRDLSSVMAEPWVGLEGGGLATGGANFIADRLRDIESAMAALPEGARVAVAGVGVALAGLGPAAWAVGRLGQTIINTGQNLRDLREVGGRVVSFFRGPWGAGIAIGAAALGILIAEVVRTRAAAREFAVEMRDSFGQQFDTSTAQGQLDQLRAQIDGMTGAVRDAADGLDYFGSMQDAMNVAEAVSEVERLEESMAHAEGTVEAVRDALGSYIPVDGILDAADALGVDLATAAREEAVEALVAFIEAGGNAEGAAGSLGDEFGDLAGEVDGAADSLDDYLTRLREATDPVFALISALDGVEAAQSAYNDAVEEYGEGSAEAESAALDVAQAVARAEAAALDGRLSFDEFRSRLLDWVAAGVITAEQAEAIERRVAEARGEAERFTARDWIVNLLANDRATSIIDRVRNNLRRLDGSNAFVNVIARGADIAGVNSPGGITQRHRGGPVDGTGPFHRGALRHDEVPLIALRDEYVVNPEASRRHRPLLDALNSGVLPTSRSYGMMLPGGHSTVDRSVTIHQTIGADVDQRRAGYEARHQARLAAIEVGR